MHSRAAKLKALDTDILSLYLKGHPAVEEKAARCLQQQGKLAFSVITYYEIMRGLKAAGLISKAERFRKFALEECDLLPLGPEALDVAAEIYARLGIAGKPLPDADILIAASCLYEDHILVSNNTKHFQRITGLELENWL